MVPVGHIVLVTQKKNSQRSFFGGAEKAASLHTCMLVHIYVL